jgi:hypothetical protein
MNCDVLDEIERVARVMYKGYSEYRNPCPREIGNTFWVTLQVPISPEEVKNIYRDESGHWKIRA